MIDIKFVASTLIVDPMTGPQKLMIFHVSSPDGANNLERINHMGVLIQPEVKVNEKIDFVFVFFLNACYTEREVLIKLGIDLSPIKAVSQIGDKLVATTEDPLQLGAVYEFNQESYTILRSYNHYTYEIEKVKE